MLVRGLQVLKYLPMEKAQDARNFVQALQYWLGGNPQNLENLLLATAQVHPPCKKDREIFVSTALLGAWNFRGLRCSASPAT